jgi:hypothetical protein
MSYQVHPCLQGCVRQPPHLRCLTHVKLYSLSCTASVVQPQLYSICTALYSRVHFTAPQLYHLSPCSSYGQECTWKHVKLGAAVPAGMAHPGAQSPATPDTQCLQSRAPAVAERCNAYLRYASCTSNRAGVFHRPVVKMAPEVTLTGPRCNWKHLEWSRVHLETRQVGQLCKQGCLIPAHNPRATPDVERVQSGATPHAQRCNTRIRHPSDAVQAQLLEWEASLGKCADSSVCELNAPCQVEGAQLWAASQCAEPIICETADVRKVRGSTPARNPLMVFFSRAQFF